MGSGGDDSLNQQGERVRIGIKGIRLSPQKGGGVVKPQERLLFKGGNGKKRSRGAP